jgi:hypothetical protein
MRLTRLIPAVGALPELYSYYCDPCCESITEVGELRDRRDLLGFLHERSRRPRLGSVSV